MSPADRMLPKCVSARNCTSLLPKSLERASVSSAWTKTKKRTRRGDTPAKLVEVLQTLQLVVLCSGTKLLQNLLQFARAQACELAIEHRVLNGLLCRHDRGSRVPEIKILEPFSNVSNNKHQYEHKDHTNRQTTQTHRQIHSHAQTHTHTHTNTHKHTCRNLDSLYPLCISSFMYLLCYFTMLLLDYIYFHVCALHSRTSVSSPRCIVTGSISLSDEVMPMQRTNGPRLPCC